MNHLGMFSPGRMICIAALMALFLFSFSLEASAQDKKIAVLPLQLHAKESQKHLKEAIPRMLSTRLSRISGYSVVSQSRIEALEIDPAELDREGALQIGYEIEADLVLKSSLSLLGESWSLDSDLLDVSEDDLLASFSHSGKEIQDLIPQLDTLSEQIGSSLGETGEVAEVRTGSQEEDISKEAAKVRTGAQKADMSEAWTGPEVERNLTGLASADVTGDGNTEMVLVDADSVLIYRVRDSRMERLEEIEAPSHTNPIAVDAGDVNGDGTAGIFVTAQNNQGNMLSSFVLQYKDGRFRRILENSPWFYRVAADAQEGDILLGQRHSREGDPFEPQVVRLEPKNGGYEPSGQLLSRAEDINVLGLALNRGKDGEESMAAVLDSRGRLRLLDQEGQAQWTTSEKYGGSNLYMQGPTMGQGSGYERFYLPGRISLLKNPHRGAQMFTFRHGGWLGVQTKRMRTFESGRIVSLDWDGQELAEEWKSRSYEGHLRDLTLGDLNSDGNLELAVLWIKSQGAWFIQPESRVIVLPLRQ